MQRRALGAQGLEVSAIGLGTMGMTMAYGRPSTEEEAIATIRGAFDAGVTSFDTAELYGMGTGSNERLVGRGIRPFRDRVVVATKFGPDLSDPSRLPRSCDCRPQHIREATENSLRLLDIDVIDVIYQHRVDPEVPIEDVAETVGALIQEGKIRHFGLSEAAGPPTSTPRTTCAGFATSAGSPANYERNAAAVERLAQLAAVQEILPQGSYGNRHPESLRYDGLSRER